MLILLQKPQPSNQAHTQDIQRIHQTSPLLLYLYEKPYSASSAIPPHLFSSPLRVPFVTPWVPPRDLCNRGRSSRSWCRGWSHTRGWSGSCSENGRWSPNWWHTGIVSYRRGNLEAVEGVEGETSWCVVPIRNPHLGNGDLETEGGRLPNLSSFRRDIYC